MSLLKLAASTASAIGGLKDAFGGQGGDGVDVSETLRLQGASFRQKMKQADHYGIHKLAMLGMNPASGPVVYNQPKTGSRMGDGIAAIQQYKQDQQIERESNARIEKLKAETDFIKQQAQASQNKTASVIANSQQDTVKAETPFGSMTIPKAGIGDDLKHRYGDEVPEFFWGLPAFLHDMASQYGTLTRDNAQVWKNKMKHKMRQNAKQAPWR